jgi:hypothetical protein
VSPAFPVPAASCCLSTVGAPTASQNLTLKIPPVRTSFTIANQPVTITASGSISRLSHEGDEQVLGLKLNADLSDLQDKLTALLRAELDRSDRCGEHIAVQHATLVPAEPASLLTAQLHFERWACAKAFGKEIAKKLVGGDALVPVKLTAAVDAGNTVRLVPEVGAVQADGALGDLLRSGSFGETLQKKIRTSLAAAIQKGIDFDAQIPPFAQGFATIQDARFVDGGSGRLNLVLSGEIRLSAKKVELLIQQVKERAAPR